MLALILRHIHSAPFEDTAIPFAELSFEETERVAMAYAAALEAAFGRSG